jgi:predicted nucleic acid-binding protein
MISSSNPPLERGLDTMVLVYSLLQGHPALNACEQHLRAHSGWFTSPWVLFEAKGVLTRVYGEDPTLTTQKLAQVAAGPVALADLDPADIITVFALADSCGLDLTDAVLLHLTHSDKAGYLATDDQRLASVCSQFGITAVSPLDAAVRQAVGVWEAAHVPTKGLPRVLRRVHQWLCQTHLQAAQDLWSQTGGASHLR